MPDQEQSRADEARQHELQTHLKEYLGLDFNEKIELINLDSLTPEQKKQLDCFNQDELAWVKIGIVPEKNWHKGSQPSESDAKRGIILFNEEYFKEKDTVAWLTHELAHCARNNRKPEAYQEDSITKFYNDIEENNTYPNNKVEKEAFTKQFQYLKNSGLAKEDIITEMEKYYDEHGMKFLNKVLEEIFSDKK